MKARIAIGNSLPDHIYHMVQNCESSKEMMEKLIVVYNKEKSSDDEKPKGKCLMACFDDLYTNDSDMFDYFHLDLFQSNQEKFTLKSEMKSLKKKLIANKNPFSRLNKENDSLLLSNKIFVT